MLENPIVNPSSISHSSQPEDIRAEVLQDYRIGWVSREVSLLARKEVLTGKAKFGIIGDGKELPQILVLTFCRHPVAAPHPSRPKIIAAWGG